MTDPLSAALDVDELYYLAVSGNRAEFERRLAAAPAEAERPAASGPRLDEWQQRALRAERFIGGITPDEWATIDKAKEAAALRAGCRLIADTEARMHALHAQHEAFEVVRDGLRKLYIIESPAGTPVDGARVPIVALFLAIFASGVLVGVWLS